MIENTESERRTSNPLTEPNALPLASPDKSWTSFGGTPCVTSATSESWPARPVPSTTWNGANGAAGVSKVSRGGRPEGGPSQL